MRAKWAVWVLASGFLTFTACAGPNGKSSRSFPLPPGADPGELLNAVPAAPARLIDAQSYYLPPAAITPQTTDVPTEPRRPNQQRSGEPVQTSELDLRQYRTDQRHGTEGPRTKPGEPRDFLVLSGIGSRSLYAYGVLCGWADTGAMPEFNVITGVSGGAFAATMLFAGREYLTDLRRLFLSIDQRRLLHGDAWDAKRFPHPIGIGTDSVATTKKIHELIHPILDAAYFVKVTAEHFRGRRLYVGTTNLDTQRFVVWDMGAIASEGTEESRKLFEDVLVASTAVPPLLEPSHIMVCIDGKRYEEMHVDGGLTRGLFWRPPSDWPGDEEDRKTGYRLLGGARVHVVLGGKVYNDPAGTKPKLLDVTLRSMKAMMFSIVRDDLARLYSTCLDRDMTMRVAAIPEDYLPLFPTDEFDPAKTRKLFCEGYTRGLDGRAWDGLPQGLADSENCPRRGTILSTTGNGFNPPSTVPCQP
jgi:hypothetical protein